MAIRDIIAGLICDRTQADVDYALSLERSSIHTDEDLRGAYNASDRNRVGGALNWLIDAVNIWGFHAKDNWAASDIVRTWDNANTLACLNRLRQVLQSGCEVPGDLNSLTYKKANAVERSLYDMCSVYMWIADNTAYCGDGYAGG